MKCNVVIGISNKETSEKIKSLLLQEGYQVTHIVESGNELIRIIRSYDIDIAVVGYKFRDMTLIDVYNRVGDLSKFLAIVNDPYKSFIQEESDIFCIGNPINKVILTSSLDMIIQSERRVNKLKKQVEVLEHKIEERKIIDKAKRKLMKVKDIEEDEAFRYIQKSAMDKRISALEIAEKILEGII